ncbi:NAD(P)-dependent dehydrogenase (short-subunit alcohol dehydrogenase family) [Thermocatellispora tengchongensis]|uniref:NAD(P)-dependent dehydrogenase (Short-subunit alcohol dehydrogenase family) n=1 Tax=Thermocatellispora tengchongensis TaxID=1073253 RepID=A0A840P7P1_9ACTN|nr:SDR family oxidoreductase [Thermocatellispora tengchongensis]MBB5135322.1 NAD(P)-dependent dehydrogenase (short-subunit alcohol dehydrogenase family) [Thermocatellispora tengchongensis]
MAGPGGVRTAVVTGGASGIGRAVVRELARRGLAVTVADIDGEAAARVAKEYGVESARLDVTDAAAVRAAIEDVAARHGRLDFVFNNAGIAAGGHAEELTAEHWDRVLDVNLRGVVHGVRAAYPIMVAQGRGHIVNTASVAGLLPAPLMLPYTASKHAVVGLSLALRAEAAAHGVRVTAVCPGFVDTPLLDHVNPGLPPTGIARHAREGAVQVQGRLYPAHKLAADIMRGVARNRALVVAPGSARIAWLLARLAPEAAVRAATRAVARATGGRRNGPA